MKLYLTNLYQIDSEVAPISFSKILVRSKVEGVLVFFLITMRDDQCLKVCFTRISERE